ncbi:MAG: DUF924 family protein [Leptolyngbyaceae cyanobacterium MO_188.B28]|nr:DUF924 family protein [Leptolyngbyaceae cyanobacterium MO_188.B28]
MDQVNEILNFWFGVPGEEASEYGQMRQVWFKKNPAFDDLVKTRFRADYERAAADQLANWRQEPKSCLALILLLDQFPRNMFRNDPRSFATDAQALAAAQGAIAHAFDQQLPPVERMFVYLPFEHSENLDHQNQCLGWMTQLAKQSPAMASTLEYAVRHRDIIARFGRFPHRNKILGRTTTPEEADFLKQRGSWF